MVNHQRLAGAERKLAFLGHFGQQSVRSLVDSRQLFACRSVGKDAYDQAAGLDFGRGLVGCLEFDCLDVHG